MTQGYFDIRNGKVVSTIKLDPLLQSWGVPYEDLSQIIENALLENKERPEIVDDVLILCVQKSIERYCADEPKDDSVKLAMVGIIIILLFAYISMSPLEKLKEALHE